MYCLVFT